MPGFVEISRPVMSPGTCFICSGMESEDRRWFDTGVDAWKMGRLYICSLCVINLANMMEINPNQELLAKVEELEKENERGNNALGVLGSLRTVFESLDFDPLASDKVLAARGSGAEKSTSK